MCHMKGVDLKQNLGRSKKVVDHAIAEKLLRCFLVGEFVLVTAGFNFVEMQKYFLDSKYGEKLCSAH